MPPEPSSIPTYLDDISLSDDNFWEAIGYRYSELFDAIRLTRFETQEQAIGKRQWASSGESYLVSQKLNWHDNDSRRSVPSWLVIPYDSERDVEELVQAKSWALNVADEIEMAIKAKTFTPKTFAEWGKFCEVGGLFEYFWLSERRVSNASKGAQAQSIYDQKRWYSHLYVRLERSNKKRNIVDGDVEVLTCPPRLPHS